MVVAGGRRHGVADRDEDVRNRQAGGRAVAEEVAVAAGIEALAIGVAGVQSLPDRGVVMRRVMVAGHGRTGGGVRRQCTRDRRHHGHQQHRQQCECGDATRAAQAANVHGVQDAQFAFSPEVASRRAGGCLREGTRTVGVQGVGTVQAQRGCVPAAIALPPARFRRKRDSRSRLRRSYDGTDLL
jgi:hypothetical protein